MALSAAAYLEKYFDCVDAMPLELQRSVTRLREIELQHRRLIGDVDVLRVKLEETVAGGSEREVGVAIQRLQHCMLAVRELGNLKMEVSSQLVDTVEEYSQQLSLSAKELDSPSRAHDDHVHHHSPRHTSTSSHIHNHNGKNDSPLMQSEMAGEKTAAKRTSSAKKPRTNHQEKPHECSEDAPPVVTGRSRENSTTSSGGGGGGGLGAMTPGNKLPRKKVKTKKKATKETAVNLPDPTHVPMPDLSSQPIDPDEPLYCHCQQVSFGEMIGCDNDECPIEWFHFQCVGLTSKPKGRWYCPQCASDKKSKSTK